MQLQQTAAELDKRGIGLAAISYDSTPTLKAFCDTHGITFPLLSDEGSTTIRRYGILNTEATGRMAGIPYPGSFLLDVHGIVVARSFEERYQERTSAAAIVAPLGQDTGVGVQKTETPHLTITTSATDGIVAPGTRFSLLLNVAPKPKMHVYSPVQKDYIPITLTLDANDAVKAHDPVFPSPEKFFFAPLKETQLVYSKPFRILQDVTVALTPAVRERAAAAGATLAIKGTLRYQACDDKVCYMPQTVPVSWVVKLRGLEK